METIQMRALRAATGGVQEGRMQNGELIPPSSWPSPPREGGPRGHRGMRNGRNDEKRTSSDEGDGRSIQVNQDDPITSDQIQPNPTKKNGPARIKAQAV